MTTFAAQMTGLGVLILLLSLPLVYRKVPMNPLYGVRIPAAFQSKERWYEVNAHGGKLLARWSVFIIAAGMAGFVLPESSYWIYHLVVLVIVLVCVVAPLIQVSRWARRLPKV